MNEKHKTRTSFNLNFNPAIVGSIILAIAAFLLYTNTLNHKFAVDDVIFVKNKLVLKGWGAFAQYLKIPEYPVPEGEYGYNTTSVYYFYTRPVTSLLFAIEMELFGERNYFVHHFINILLYSFTAVLLFLLLNRLFKNNWILAFISTIIFIAHPIHTEVVANIKSRDEILSFLFGFVLTMLFLLRYVNEKNGLASEASKKSYRIFYILSLICFTLGLFSKENAITFIAVVPLSLYFFSQMKLKTIIKISLPYILIGLFYIAWRGIYVEIIGHEKPDIIQNILFGATSWDERYATAFYILFIYLKLLIYPHPLIWDYSYKQIQLTDFSNPQVLASLLIHLLFLILAIAYLKKKNLISYIILFYFITFSVNSNLFIITGCTLGERLIYTSSLSYSIFIALLMSSIFQFQKRNRALLKISGIIFMLAILGLYTYKTLTRNTDWRDDLALNLKDIQNAPNSARINHILGIMHISRAPKERNWIIKTERYNQAIDYLERAVKIYSKSRIDWWNLAVAYYKVNKQEKSKLCFKKYLELETDDFEYVKRIRGLGLYEAKVEFKKLKNAYIQDTNNINLLYKLGELNLYSFENFTSASEYFKKALDIAPEYSDAIKELATSLYYNGNYNDAITNFKKASELTHKQILLKKTGDCYLRKNESDSAMYYYTKYLEWN